MKIKKDSKIFRIAITGILGALALALSFAEHFIFAPLPLPPGVKPGFSNIIVMFTCSSLGLLPALGIALIKSGFAMILSGGTAGFISLSGGILSVLSMYILLKLSKSCFSYTGISVISSCMHNLGQMAAASVVAGCPLFLPYAPVLMVSGVIFGFVTGIILTYVMPHLGKLEF